MFEATVEDIKKYLATKQANDVVGTTQSTRCCLVAETLRHKYGGAFRVGGAVPAVCLDTGEEVTIPPEVIDIIRKFDRIRDWAIDVERWRLEEEIPELK